MMLRSSPTLIRILALNVNLAQVNLCLAAQCAPSAASAVLQMLKDFLLASLVQLAASKTRLVNLLVIRAQPDNSKQTRAKQAVCPAAPARILMSKAFDCAICANQANLLNLPAANSAQIAMTELFRLIMVRLFVTIAPQARLRFKAKIQLRLKAA
jgi:folate-binding Fe-S cluster repair protein YgfZ